MHILTFDIEEWFHLLDFDQTSSEKSWSGFPVRIYENVDRILNILEETNCKATFFIIGWIAQKYPDIVKRISEKYEIGSHTYSHQLVWQQKPSVFKEDVQKSITLLEDITGKKVTAFRAPGFSVRKSEGWAFEILSSLGITTDCSVFPAHHAHGGMPEYPSQLPSIITLNGTTIKEFPIPTKTIFGKHIVFSGGGYFRLFPYSLIKKWSLEHRDYMMAYIHPRDLDAGQPMLKNLPLTRKFKSYYGLSSAEEKLRKYLTDFPFTDVRSAEKEILWHNMPTITL
ncbi:MAG: polysaccharide deacetylase family protein [Endomicrobium sp.]|jgi:polysaccharide deacetylase family protein (PEP-CTERM system associated)|nr:polysaccharide deacetylase family protein [Endomicrobium sp.]